MKNDWISTSKIFSIYRILISINQIKSLGKYQQSLKVQVIESQKAQIF